MPFPDVEAVVRAYLAARLTDTRVTTTLPADLEQRMPLVRIIRAGGADDGITDRPRLDVEAFAADRGGMWTLAEAVRDALHDLAGSAVTDKLVDTVTTEAGPAWLDYGNPATHRAVATYRLTLRRH